jgi:hypothetical protein
MAGLFRGLLAWTLLFGAAACERHVQLKFPNSGRGEEFVCHPTTSQVEKCEPRTNLNPADDNKANTAFVILPAACGGHFHEITIHDSGSSEPSVNVKCAPPENKIPMPEPVVMPSASASPAPAPPAAPAPSAPTPP